MKISNHKPCIMYQSNCIPCSNRQKVIHIHYHEIWSTESLKSLKRIHKQAHISQWKHTNTEYLQAPLQNHCRLELIQIIDTHMRLMSSQVRNLKIVQQIYSWPSILFLCLTILLKEEQKNPNRKIHQNSHPTFTLSNQYNKHRNREK